MSKKFLHQFSAKRAQISFGKPRLQGILEISIIIDFSVDAQDNVFGLCFVKKGGIKNHWEKRWHVNQAHLDVERWWQFKRFSKLRQTHSSQQHPPIKPQGLETELKVCQTPTVQPCVKVVWKQRSKTRLASLNNGWSPLSGSTMAKRSCAMMVLPWAPKCRSDHHVSSRLSIASAHHPLTHYLSSTIQINIQTKMSITRIYISRISHWLPVVPKAKMISETL